MNHCVFCNIVFLIEITKNVSNRRNRRRRKWRFHALLTRHSSRKIQYNTCGCRHSIHSVPELQSEIFRSRKLIMAKTFLLLLSVCVIQVGCSEAMISQDDNPNCNRSICNERAVHRIPTVFGLTNTDTRYVRISLTLPSS